MQSPEQTSQQLKMIASGTEETVGAFKTEHKSDKELN